MLQSVRVNSQSASTGAEGKRGRINRRDDLPIVITRLVKQPVAKKHGAKHCQSCARMAVRDCYISFVQQVRRLQSSGRRWCCRTGHKQARSLSKWPCIRTETSCLSTQWYHFWSRKSRIRCIPSRSALAMPTSWTEPCSVSVRSLITQFARMSVGRLCNYRGIISASLLLIIGHRKTSTRIGEQINWAQSDLT